MNGNGTLFGGQGFSGLLTNGATLNTVITNSNILSNANQGIVITADGANSLANFHVGSTAVQSNASEGLVIDVTNQAQVNYRSFGSVYSNNGSAGTFDGVQVNATGNGPLNSATAILLFANGIVDNNTGNGFSLNAANGATLTTSIQNMDISNNTGYGINATATGTNTQFNLLMSGTNTLTGNGLGSFSPLDFSNINQAILEVSGTFRQSDW